MQGVARPEVHPDVGRLPECEEQVDIMDVEQPAVDTAVDDVVERLRCPAFHVLSCSARCSGVGCVIRPRVGDASGLAGTIWPARGDGGCSLLGRRCPLLHNCPILRGPHTTNGFSQSWNDARATEFHPEARGCFRESNRQPTHYVPYGAPPV